MMARLAGEFGTSDGLFTGVCGTDWFPLGGPTLTSTSFGATRSGGNLVAVSRANDHDTMWTSTSAGRLFVSKNANNADPASVTFTRIDTPTQPTRVPVAISVDSTNPNHAVVAYSGYSGNTPTTPGHVFLSFLCSPMAAAGAAAPTMKAPFFSVIETISGIFFTSTMVPGSRMPDFIWTSKSVPPAST